MCRSSGSSPGARETVIGCEQDNTSLSFFLIRCACKGYGSLNCPPNMTKILCQWGLGRDLEDVSVKCQKINMMSGEILFYL